MGDMELYPTMGAVFSFSPVLSRTEKEVALFKWVTEVRRPESDLKPDGVRMGGMDWGQMGAAGIARFGDVVGPLWNVGFVGEGSMKMLGDPLRTSYVEALGCLYSEWGVSDDGDSGGVSGNRFAQLSTVAGVVLANSAGVRRLIANRCIVDHGLQSARQPELKWPPAGKYDGSIREITYPEKCQVLRNKHWRNAALPPDNITIDTVWRSTPLMLWRESLVCLAMGSIWFLT